VDNPSAAPRQGSPAGERLDSWKEIASYLRKSVRSVQRWEAEEGLPVHRHQHEKRGTVYAFAAELDAWWKERGAILTEQNGAVESEAPAADLAPVEAEPAPEIAPALPRKSRRAVWVAAGFAAAVLTASVVAWLSRNGSGLAAGPLPFEARDWVLVAGFENRTGEKLFDGTLDYALGRELSNSRHVNVVSRDRVEDSLRLMRKPLDVPLDAALAREVAVRDGEIRALLTGRVEKLGSKYLFSVEIVDPKQSATLAGFSEESAGMEGSLPAMRRISDRVRTALGEKSPPPGDPDRAGLAKVTTANLKALQLYSQADLLMARDNNQAAAEELLRQAVAEDPTFASAWIHLAWTLANQGRPVADFQPFAEKALRLAETTAERERYFIRGSYYHLLGEGEKAIAAYEALVGLHPDHSWAVGNLTSLYKWQVLLPDLRKAVQLEARHADSRPRDFRANWDAAFNFLVRVREPVRARPYVRRATELITPEVTDRAPNAVTWLSLLPFTENWLKGDLEAAAIEIDEVAAKIDSLGGRARDRFALATALGYLTLGRIEAAARTTGKIVDPVIRNDMLAQIAFVKGDDLALRRHLRSHGDPQLERTGGATSETPGAFPLAYWETTTILQARTGQALEAREVLEAQRPLKEEQEEAEDLPEFYRVPGEIALAGGDLAGAIAELEKAMTLDDGAGTKRPGFYLGSESLAAALAKSGDAPRAIQVLERHPERRDAVISGNTGAYWLRNRLELARLYRGVGRVEEARVVEAELAKLLVLADRDHPILLELERLQKS
jgi:tetratricopeptide (TPR) repeat protein